MLLEIFSILILTTPTMYAVWEDRHGDKHPNHDLWYVVALMLLTSLCISAFNPKIGVIKDVLRGVSLSAGIYIFLFPYLVNIVLYRNKVISDKRWWDHLSTTAWPDRLPMWSGTPWYGRMFILFALFMACCMVYVCPCKITSFYNDCFTLK